MRVARISIAEFKSESEVNRFVDDADRTFWDLYPTAEACYQVRTGPTSIINVTIYPNEEAATKTLSGRNQFVEEYRDSIIDTFFHVGEVAFSKSEKNVFSYNSIGQKNYLSCLSYFDLVLGNSSSGIIEAPFFNIPTVNIGDRQLGRICGETIINSTSNFDSILKSFRTALSQDFVNKKKNTINPYCSGNKSPSKEIIKILENLDYEFILEKRFYDIEFNY